MQRTYYNELVVFANATESVCPSITAEFVEGNPGDEGRMTLTSCDHPLLPWREDRDEIILPARLMRGRLTIVKAINTFTTYKDKSTVW